MKKWIAIISGIVLILGVIPMVITGVVYEMNFGRRYETGASYAYKVEDFEGLERQKYTFTSKQGNRLQGYTYDSKDIVKPKALVVFAHGFGGGGHTSYMPEINYLVTQGYQVFTYDVTGNDASEGKAVRGMPQGILDLDQALYFVEEQQVFERLPILLYGHSWGAYSVMSELSLDHQITAAVAASGFNQSTDIMIEQGVQMYGNRIKVLKPYMKLYEAIKFGKVGSLSSVQGLGHTEAKVLVIHSTDDPVISYNNSFAYFKEVLKDKKNIQLLTLKDRGHEFARSHEVQMALEKVSGERRALKEQYGSVEAIPDGIKHELAEKNKVIYAQLDQRTMERISLFYDQAIGGKDE